uniref:Uncharacterized protein n=1 Tax=Avena sativa TaxID=4498 RepID=A0ACD5UNS3_AVESA
MPGRPFGALNPSRPRHVFPTFDPSGAAPVLSQTLRFPATRLHTYTNGDTLPTRTQLHQGGRRQPCQVAAATRTANQGRKLDNAPDRSVGIGVRRWADRPRISGRGKFAVVAVSSDDYLPMRSNEVKNRTSADDIKSLRLITAVKTPYLPDGRFDLQAYDSLINMQIESGADGVIVGGTTGEGHLMSWDEHIMLIGHTVNCFGTKIKVIGNTGSNSTGEAVHATEQGFAVGMHAALHINPYYGKTSTEGLISHFEHVLPMGPTIIYNVPSRTSQDIPPPVIEAVSRHANMAGVKECVGHERVKCYTDKAITVWSGNDDECHDSRWKYGATGVISVASNLVPGLMRNLMYEGGNAVLNEKLLPLMRWLFCQPNPIGLNTALAQLGVARPVFRLPYVPLPHERRAEFVRIVEAIGREHFVGQKKVQVLDDDDFVLICRY